MSLSINRVQIYGNITRDPELRSLPSGAAVASLGIATNRTFTDKGGQKQKETEFHDVTAFGKIAELICQYLHKGDGVYIEGRLKTRSWVDKNDGRKRYKTEIIAESMQFGPRKAESPESGENAPGNENLSENTTPGNVDVEF